MSPDGWRFWVTYAVVIAAFAVLGAWKVAPWFAGFVVVQGAVQILPAVWLLRSSGVMPIPKGDK